MLMLITTIECMTIHFHLHNIYRMGFYPHPVGYYESCGPKVMNNTASHCPPNDSVLNTNHIIVCHKIKKTTL